MADYTLIWNVLHYPCGVLPITLVQENEQYYEDEYNDFITKAIKDDIKDSKDMPVCVQVVSYIFEDEIALGVMKAIDDKIKFNFVPKII